MTAYQTYVSALYAYVNATVGKCHTLERTNCPSINAADQSAGFTKQYKASVTAKHGHELTGTPPCVLSTLFPNAEAPPVVSTACPQVKCGSVLGTGCGNFTVNATSGNRSFVGQLCGKGQVCNGLSTAVFTNTAAQNFTCITPTVTPMPTRLPGEKCDSNNQCMNNQTCTTNNVCTGQAVGANCTTHTDCVVGSYCAINVTNVTNSMCTKQVASGATCNATDYMCPQTQGCFNGTCTDYYSKPLNTDVSTVIATGGLPSTFCQSMHADTTNKVCYGKSYGANMNISDSKSGLVKCILSQQCNYIDNLNVSLTENCQCSYDQQGNSYCRKAYTENDSGWKSLASSARAKMSSTNCHTTHRFGCWDTPQSALTSTYDARIVTDAAHDFFYAEDCIKKLFNSAESLKLSFLLLAVLLINLF